MLQWHLLIVHLLYDWHWQGEFVGTMKSKTNFILGIHCLTWATLMYLVLLYHEPRNIGFFWFLFASHYAIDYWKCRIVKEENRLKTDILLIDQFLHVLSLLMCL